MDKKKESNQTEEWASNMSRHCPEEETEKKLKNYEKMLNFK